MIAGIRFKVCGLTSLVDAECADKCGADYLGFNLYPKSPRGILLSQFKAMAKLLPDRRKVAVTVEPSSEELKEMQDAGFDFFQIHFRETTSLETVMEWSSLVMPERLWLAPKLLPESDLQPAWLSLADTFMLDGFSADKFGGTGEKSDWTKFSRYQAEHPGKHWLLAGGLGPDNIVEAIQQTGTTFVDINSGVETAPGIKDHAKLKRFVVSLNESRS